MTAKNDGCCTKATHQRHDHPNPDNNRTIIYKLTIIYICMDILWCTNIHTTRAFVNASWECSKNSSERQDRLLPPTSSQSEKTTDKSLTIYKQMNHNGISYICRLTTYLTTIQETLWSPSNIQYWHDKSHITRLPCGHTFNSFHKISSRIERQEGLRGNVGITRRLIRNHMVSIWYRNENTH